MKHLILILGLLFTTTSVRAQKAYEPGHDDSISPKSAAEIVVETNVDIYKQILNPLAASLRTQVSLMQKYRPYLSLPLRVVIRDIPYRASGGLHYIADNDNTSTTRGSIEIYEGEIFDPTLEGIAIHEYFHAVLRANWGPDDKSLARRSLEELLCDLYPRLMRPDIQLVQKFELRSFEIAAPFRSAKEFTEQHARQIAGNDDYLKAFPFNDSKPGDHNDPHEVLAPVRRFLNISQMDTFSPAEKLRYFEFLMSFFKREILDQMHKLEIKTAYDLNRKIIEKLEQRR